MNQKGSILHLVILFVLVACGIVGGLYYLKSKDYTNQSSAIVKSTSIPAPTTSASYEPLSTAEEKGLTTYDRTELGFTFQYPAFFNTKIDYPVRDQETINYYAQKNKDFQFPLFTIILTVPQLSDDQITAADKDDPNFYANYSNNIMRVGLYKFDNPQGLSLYNFISNQYKIYPGNGSEMTFNDFKHNLKETSIPFPHSYENSNSVSESPIKIVFFEVKSKIYMMTLGGGLQTGEGYSPEAENIFTKILQTIKIK